MWTINKSFLINMGKQHQEAWFYIKDQVAFDAYMETLQELCRKDGISTKLTVCYNSLQVKKHTILMKNNRLCIGVIHT